MKEILEYQKLDMELRRVKKSSSENLDTNNINKLKSYILEASEKGKNLENSAKQMLAEYGKMKDEYEKNCKKIQELTSKSIDSIEMGDVDNILAQINSLSQELFLLERNLNLFITKIKSSLKEFEVTKNNMIKAKQKYNEVKSKYEKGLEVTAPKIKEIEEKMKAMEKTIDQDLLSKYKSMKGDKIFPVFVSLNDGHCSGCRVEIPTSRINKLKTDGKIICEQCHRIIYN
jgi:predicted  nucleic acid-binding Zn-ribbon protein